MITHNGYTRVGLASHWISLVVGLTLTVAACGEQTPAGKSPSPPRLHWSQTASPSGIDVPGAQWLQIEGAGGRPKNIQVAAVFRPAGEGPFPVVIYLHSDFGLGVDDLQRMKRLAAGGFIVLAGCWKFTPANALIGGVSYELVACLRNLASVDDAIAALIDVGRAMPGAKKDAMGLVGFGGGGGEVLKLISARSDIRAAAVASPFVWRERLLNPSKVSSVSFPVLLIAGTAGTIHPIAEAQQYEQALRAAGKTVEAHYYEDEGDAPTLLGQTCRTRGRDAPNRRLFWPLPEIGLGSSQRPMGAEPEIVVASVRRP